MDLACGHMGLRPTLVGIFQGPRLQVNILLSRAVTRMLAPTLRADVTHSLCLRIRDNVPPYAQTQRHTTSTPW